MSTTNVKVGAKFYNKDKDHIATIIKQSDVRVQYYWERVDGKNLEGFMHSAGGKCTVTVSMFDQYVKQGSLKKLTPLEMELL